MEPRDPRPTTQPNSGIAPEAMLAEAIARGDFDTPSRRGFLTAGAFGAAALLLAACTPSRSTLLPDAQWARADDLDAICPVPGKPAGRATAAKPKPLPSLAVANAPAALPYAKPRRIWARGEPDVSVLNPMLPVSAITVHHDGLDTLVALTTVENLNAHAYATLTPEGLAWLQYVLDEAKACGRTLALAPPHGTPVLRRYWICDLIITIANHADDDLAWCLLDHATGHTIPHHSLGDAFGTLRKTEAQKGLGIAYAIDNLDLTPMWDESGIRFEGDINAAMRGIPTDKETQP
jgi:hypothetical protein